jgi:hypothetical protein
MQNDVPELGLVSVADNRSAEPGGLPTAELHRGGFAACFIGAGDVSGRAAWMAGIAGLAVRRNRKQGERRKFG